MRLQLGIVDIDGLIHHWQRPVVQANLSSQYTYRSSLSRGYAPRMSPGWVYTRARLVKDIARCYDCICSYELRRTRPPFLFSWRFNGGTEGFFESFCRRSLIRALLRGVITDVWAFVFRVRFLGSSGTWTVPEAACWWVEVGALFNSSGSTLMIKLRRQL